MRTRRSGFSLVEVLLAMAILAIIAEALYVTVFRSTTTFSNNTRMGSLQEDARGALDSMVNEFRMADKTRFLITGPAGGPNSVTFYVSTGVAAGAVTWSTPITYQLQPAAAVRGPNASAQNLVRIQNGQTHRMCDFVTPVADLKHHGLAITKVSGDNYTITLDLSIIDESGKTIESTLQCSVTLRNSS
jgi:prepilin-type N-terminal cleavage/methylation domain-containing protein